MSKVVSQRTCVGCQTTKPKKELVRISVGENNNLMVDPIGKAVAVEKKAFQRAFKKKLNVNDLWQNKKEKPQRNQNFNSAPQ